MHPCKGLDAAGEVSVKYECDIKADMKSVEAQAMNFI